MYPLTLWLTYFTIVEVELIDAAHTSEVKTAFASVPSSDSKMDEF